VRNPHSPVDKPTVDVVTVWHRDFNRAQAEALRARLADIDPEPHHYILVDNSPAGSRSFAAGCNAGSMEGTAPLILFLNPDCVIDGPFLGTLKAEFDEDPTIVIAGHRFGRPSADWRDRWGCNDWVCGAAMMVRRSWFAPGFDEAYQWGWEETDLIRRAEQQRWRVKSIPLPVRHAVDGWDDRPEDTAVKTAGLHTGSQLFYKRWGRQRTPPPAQRGQRR
jgi:hypothetical protein